MADITLKSGWARTLFDRAWHYYRDPKGPRSKSVCGGAELATETPIQGQDYHAANCAICRRMVRDLTTNYA